MTKREIADYLHVSEQTIANHVKRGLFHPVRMGRRLGSKTLRRHRIRPFPWRSLSSPMASDADLMDAKA